MGTPWWMATSILFTAALAQSSLLPAAGLVRVRPDLVLLCVVAWAVLRGVREAMSGWEWRDECREGRAVGAGEPPPREPRLVAFYGFMALAFLVLAGQLWRVQVAAGDQYRRRADVNRVRVVTEKPPRGVIYDRAGRPVARDVSSFTASVRPADLPKNDDRQDEV